MLSRGDVLMALALVNVIAGMVFMWHGQFGNAVFHLLLAVAAVMPLAWGRF